MEVPKLEDMTKEELIEVVRLERGYTLAALDMLAHKHGETWAAGYADEIRSQQGKEKRQIEDHTVEWPTTPDGELVDQPDHANPVRTITIDQLPVQALDSAVDLQPLTEMCDALGKNRIAGFDLRKPSHCGPRFALLADVVTSLSGDYMDRRVEPAAGAPAFVWNLVLDQSKQHDDQRALAWYNGLRQAQGVKVADLKQYRADLKRAKSIVRFFQKTGQVPYWERHKR